MNVICHIPHCKVSCFNSPERLQETGWLIEGTDIRCPEHNGHALTKAYYSDSKGVLLPVLDHWRAENCTSEVIGSALPSNHNLQEGARPSIPYRVGQIHGDMSMGESLGGSQRGVGKVGEVIMEVYERDHDEIANPVSLHKTGNMEPLHQAVSAGLTGSPQLSTIVGQVTMREETALKLIAEGKLSPNHVKQMDYKQGRDLGLLTSWMN